MNRLWSRFASPLCHVLLVVVDTAMLLVAFVLAWGGWALPVRYQGLDLYLRVLPLLSGFLLGYGVAGLYRIGTLGPIERLRRLSLVNCMGCLGLAGLAFALKLPPTFSRVTFVLFWLLCLVTVPLGRAFVATLNLRWRWLRQPALLVGMPPTPELVTDLQREGLEIVHACSTGMAEVDSAIPTARALGARDAIVLADSVSSDLVLRLALSLRRLVVHDPTIGSLIAGGVVRPLGPILALEIAIAGNDPLNRLAKRAVDLMVGAVAALVTLPLLALAALAVIAVDPGSPFFAQEREGRAGRRIRVFKLRTMRRDAERRLADHLGASEEARAEWERRFKLGDDPRILPYVGRFLRRYSIDELPQLWNVLAGSMSLVGPRPFPDYHLARLPSDFRTLRREVRPGLTGLWQVTVRSAGELEDQRELDTFYIRNWSLWMDMWILGRTVGAVASGRGAY